MNIHDVESVLRAAPRPPTPPGLEQRLTSQVRLRPGNRNVRSPRLALSWIRRWWPTLLVGGGVLACAATLLTQRAEIQRLQAQLAAITAVNATGGPSADSREIAAAPTEDDPMRRVEDRRAEMARLRLEIAELKDGLAQAEELLAARRQLEAQLAAQFGLTEEDLNALDLARDKANSIKCVNNLKNIGLALRIWAKDYEGRFPLDFLSLTNELVTPKLLICPADTTRTEAADWASFSGSHQSYEFLAPGGSEADTQCVAARCPMHRHICLTDGSVQMSQGDGTNLTPYLVNQNGKLYFKPPQ